MLRTALIISLLVLSTAGHAKLYKCEDIDGNTIYTDKSCGDGKELKLPPIQTYTPQQIPQNTNVDTTSGPVSVPEYTKLAITKPLQDEVILESTGKVDVDISVEPGLQQALGHSFQLTLDGNRLPTKGVTTRVRLDNLDQGKHTVKVVIVDSKGGLVKESALVTFYAKRKSLLQPESVQGAQKPQVAPGAPRAPALLPPPPSAP